ncbi:MAG: 30S ribosome-binding factor RbfA [Rhodobacteraceae bacterium]|jgi:ribosome-binding factor A|nr:30S ribosome-binding factor RbfA [Paracoccaceae bacterium]
MSRTRDSRGSGPSQRQLRVGEAIRRRLAEVLQRGEVHDPELDRMAITVSEVRASPDLKQATAFVLPLGGGGREAALALLNRHRTELRRAVAAALELKFAPELRFVLDDSFDRMDAARRLLDDPAVRADVARPATGDD